MRLTIELVPQSSWYKNVRSHVTPGEWQRIRLYAINVARYHCTVCHSRLHPAHIHEQWAFDDFLGIQKLEKMLAMCAACHLVKHIEFAKTQGRFLEALQHFMRVNEVSHQEALRYVRDQVALWHRRNRQPWHLDVRYLQRFMQWQE